MGMIHPVKDGLVCSLCGTAAEPAGPGQSAAASDFCAGCKLHARHRAVGTYLRTFGDPTVSAKSIICSGTPGELRYLFPRAHDLLNFDIHPLPYVSTVMDIQNMEQIPQGSRDVFIALNVLNYVADDGRAVQEVARVLKPGTGQFLLTAYVRQNGPTLPVADVARAYGQEILDRYGVGDYRRYGLADFRRLLEPYFAVTEFSFDDPLVGTRSIVFHARRLAEA